MVRERRAGGFHRSRPAPAARAALLGALALRSSFHFLSFVERR
jgi:hypothetical protein